MSRPTSDASWRQVPVVVRSVIRQPPSVAGARTMPCEPDTDVVEFGADTFMSELRSPFWMSTSIEPNFSFRSTFSLLPCFASSSTLACVSGFTSILTFPVKSSPAVDDTDVQISEPFFSFIFLAAAIQSLSSGRLTSTVPLNSTSVASNSSRLSEAFSCAVAASAIRTRTAAVLVMLLVLRIRVALFLVDRRIRDHVDQLATRHVLVDASARHQPPLDALAERVATVDPEQPHREAAFDLQRLADHVGERPLREQAPLQEAPVGLRDAAAVQIVGDRREVGVAVRVLDHRQDGPAGVAVGRAVLLEDPTKVGRPALLGLFAGGLVLGQQRQRGNECRRQDRPRPSAHRPLSETIRDPGAEEIARRVVQVRFPR